MKFTKVCVMLKKRYTKNNSPEHDIQVKIAKYIDALGLLWTASAGGARMGIRTAVKMKASGYRKGCPDIMVFEPRGKYCGLFIELKTLTGTATKEQKAFILALEDRGYRASICKGFDATKREIDDYLKGNC